MTGVQTCALPILVELGEARGELAGAGTRGRDHHEGLGARQVLVLAEALVGDDAVDVVDVLTKLGIRSRRRWYWFSTFDHCSDTF